MTLHEAIAHVLEGGRRLSSADIAHAINLRGLYTRGDGRPLPASQISARVSNHPELFGRDDSYIWLAQAPLAVAPKSVPQASDAQILRPNRPTRELPVFEELGRIGDLLEYGLPPRDWLKCSGVYMLKIPVGYTPRFIPPADAVTAGNVVRPRPTEQLRAKWVPAVDVIYIGVAGRNNPRSLRARLTELLNHARGNTTTNGPHCGGEIVWQLQDHRALLLSAAATADPPAPRETELALVAEFKSQHGTRPFGNRQD